MNYKEYIVKKAQGKNIVIWGMGSYGKASYDMLYSASIVVDFFCDMDEKKIGTKYRNILCISYKEVLKFPNKYFVLIANQFLKEICTELELNGFSKDGYNIIPSPYKIDFDCLLEKISNDLLNEKINIINDFLADKKSKDILHKLQEVWFKNNISQNEFEDIYDENQYFCENIISIDDKTIYVDIGAYLGDSLKLFLKNSNGNFQKAICFELNKSIFYKLCHFIHDLDSKTKNKIIAVNNGISDKNQIVRYVDTEGSSHIGGDGNEIATLVTLDEYFKNDEIPTLIKMDIEGAELSALKGAEQIIKRYKPNLAICVYHKLQDLWEIPEYIKSLVPEYKIYLRHHSNTMIETVCYAVMR